MPKFMIYGVLLLASLIVLAGVGVAFVVTDRPSTPNGPLSINDHIAAMAEACHPKPGYWTPSERDRASEWISQHLKGQVITATVFTKHFKFDAHPSPTWEIEVMPIREYAHDYHIRIFLNGPRSSINEALITDQPLDMLILTGEVVTSLFMPDDNSTEIHLFLRDPALQTMDQHLKSMTQAP